MCKIEIENLLRDVMKIIPLGIIILSFSSLAYAEAGDKTAKPLIYNEEALTEQLNGKDSEEVLKILGEPAVKKPPEESDKYSGYWWYDLPETGIFVYFQDGKVYNISILTEDKRSKEL